MSWCRTALRFLCILTFSFKNRTTVIHFIFMLGAQFGIFCWNMMRCTFRGLDERLGKQLIFVIVLYFKLRLKLFHYNWTVTNYYFPWVPWILSNFWQHNLTLEWTQRIEMIFHFYHEFINFRFERLCISSSYQLDCHVSKT